MTPDTGREAASPPSAGRPKKVLLTAMLIAVAWSSLLARGFSYRATDDAQEYDQIAQNLIAGHGFSLSTTPPFLPTLYREPAYPVFLSLVYAIAGYRYGVAQAVQIGLFVLTVWLTYEVARGAFDERIAGMVSLGTALAPPLANFPSYLLSETFFTCLLMALVWALVKTSVSGRLSWAALAGVLWGMVVLCRAVTVVFLIPIYACWWMLHKFREAKFIQKPQNLQREGRTQGPPRRPGGGGLGIFVRCLIFLFSAAIIIGPWLLRNSRQFNTHGVIAVRGGRVVWERAQRLDYTAEQIAQSFVFIVSEFLGKRLFPTAVDQPRDFLLRESGLANARVAAWREKGWDELTIDRQFLSEGLARIRRKPVTYLVQSGLEWFKLTAFCYLPVLNEPGVEQVVGRVSGGRVGLALLRGTIRSLAFPVLLLAGLGAYTQRSQWRRWVFVAVPLLSMNVAHSLLTSYGRYAVPLIPGYLMFACAGWEALQGWRRDRMGSSCWAMTG